jgi:hypothetical protein
MGFPHLNSPQLGRPAFSPVPGHTPAQAERTPTMPATPGAGLASNAYKTPNQERGRFMHFLNKTASKVKNLAKTAFGRLARKLSTRSSKSSEAASLEQENPEGASEEPSHQPMPKRDSADGQSSGHQEEKPASKQSQAAPPPTPERKDSVHSAHEPAKKTSPQPPSDAAHKSHVAEFPDTRHKSVIDFEASGMRSLMNTLSPKLSAAEYDNALQRLDKHLTAMKPTDDGVELIKAEVSQQILRSGKGFDAGSKANQMLVKWMSLDTQTLGGRLCLSTLSGGSDAPRLTPDQTYTLMDMVAEKVAITDTDPMADGRLMLANVRDRITKDHPALDPGLLTCFDGACQVASVPPSDASDSRNEAFNLVLTLQHPDFAAQHGNQIMGAIKDRLEVAGKDEQMKEQPMRLNGHPLDSSVLRTLLSYQKPDRTFSTKEEEMFKLWDQKLFGINS